MPDIVVCLSGGLDSTLLATMALTEGRLAACITYHYGQPHGEPESEAARVWCRDNKIERVFVVLDAAGGRMAIGSGVAGPRVVPGRNLAMLAHAVQYAAVRGLKEVWYGPTLEDRDNYPDCRPEFVEAMNRTSSVYGVAVRAPLMDMTKRQIVAKARELGVNIEATWSCYEPRWMGFSARPCGGCDACRKRNDALLDPVAEMRRKAELAWPGATITTHCPYALRRADGTVEEHWSAIVGHQTFRGSSELEALTAAVNGAHMEKA